MTDEHEGTFAPLGRAKLGIRADTIVIPDTWTPTSETLQALPDALRRYIHELQTVCDPAGDVRELYRLKVENKMLRQECARLAVKAGEAPADA